MARKVIQHASRIYCEKVVSTGAIPEFAGCACHNTPLPELSNGSETSIYFYSTIHYYTRSKHGPCDFSMTSNRDTPVQNQQIRMEQCWKTCMGMGLPLREKYILVMSSIVVLTYIATNSRNCISISGICTGSFCSGDDFSVIPNLASLFNKLVLQNHNFYRRRH